MGELRNLHSLAGGEYSQKGGKFGIRHAEGTSVSPIHFSPSLNFQRLSSCGVALSSNLQTRAAVVGPEELQLSASSSY